MIRVTSGRCASPTKGSNRECCRETEPGEVYHDEPIATRSGSWARQRAVSRLEIHPQRVGHGPFAAGYVPARGRIEPRRTTLKT
jgi:hypothetical protein